MSGAPRPPALPAGAAAGEQRRASRRRFRRPGQPLVPRTPALREVSTTGRSAILTVLVSPPAGGACGRPKVTQSTCHRSLFTETSDKIIEETHVDLPCAVMGPAYHIRPRGGKQMLATCPRRLYDELPAV